MPAQIVRHALAWVALMTEYVYHFLEVTKPVFRFPRTIGAPPEPKPVKVAKCNVTNKHSTSKLFANPATQSTILEHYFNDHTYQNVTCNRSGFINFEYLTPESESDSLHPQHLSTAPWIIVTIAFLLLLCYKTSISNKLKSIRLMYESPQPHQSFPYFTTPAPSWPLDNDSEMEASDDYPPTVEWADLFKYFDLSNLEESYQTYRDIRDSQIPAEEHALEQALHQRDSELEEHKATISALRKELSDMHSKSTSSEEALRKEKDLRHSAEQRFKKTADQLESKISELKTSMSRKDMKSSVYVGRYKQEMLDDKHALQDLKEASEKEGQQLRAQISRLESKVKEGQQSCGRISDLEWDVTDRENQIRVLRSDFTIRRIRYRQTALKMKRASKKESERQRATISDLEAQVTDQDSRLTTLQASLTEKLGSYKRLNEAFEQSLTAIRERNWSISNLQSEVKAKDAEISNLKASSGRLQDSFGKLKLAFKQKQEASTASEGQLSALRAAMAAKDIELQDAKRTLEAQEQANEEVVKALSSYEKNKADANVAYLPHDKRPPTFETAAKAKIEAELRLALATSFVFDLLADADHAFTKEDNISPGDPVPEADLAYDNIAFGDDCMVPKGMEIVRRKVQTFGWELQHYMQAYRTHMAEMDALVKDMDLNFEE